MDCFWSVKQTQNHVQLTPVDQIKNKYQTDDITFCLTILYFWFYPYFHMKCVTVPNSTIHTTYNLLHAERTVYGYLQQGDTAATNPEYLLGNFPLLLESY